MARKERALHMQLYPGWSARDNYAQQGKKKKRKRDKSQGKNDDDLHIKFKGFIIFLNLHLSNLDRPLCPKHFSGGLGAYLLSKMQNTW